MCFVYSEIILRDVGGAVLHNLQEKVSYGMTAENRK